MDERANDIGESADGRRRPGQAAHRRFVRVAARFGLPASDRRGSEPENARSLRLREAEEPSDAQDAVPKLRRVMGSPRLVDLVEMLPEDVCDFLKSAKKDFIELGLAESCSGSGSLRLSAISRPKARPSSLWAWSKARMALVGKRLRFLKA